MTESQPGRQFSGRLFARLYVVLLLSIIVIGTGLVYVVRQVDEASEVDYIKAVHRPFMALLQQSLTSEPAADWPQLLAQWGQAAERELTLLSIQDFAADQATMQALVGGELLVLFGDEDSMTLYQSLANTPQVLAVEVPMAAIIVDEPAWVAPLFYLLIALVVYLLIRPFAKQLLKLKDAAIQLGRGDFSARLKLPPSNTLTPIADAFNGMAHKIERLLLTQRDMVNAVSHELRTPLARLKFSFEALDLPAHDQAYLVGMKKDVSELEALIDEMLRYAEVNQITAFQASPVPLVSLVDKLIDDMGESGQQVAVVYEASVDPDMLLVCHEHGLNRALANVLRNALSFAEQLCELRICRQADRLWINISDDGPGLHEDHLDRIFEPFYKVNNEKRHAGYGLGLAIAQSIAKKHEGSLSVVKGHLKGACFRFDLPVKEPS